jgi:hypothetical protein
MSENFLIFNVGHLHVNLFLIMRNGLGSIDILVIQETTNSSILNKFNKLITKLFLIFGIHKNADFNGFQGYAFLEMARYLIDIIGHSLENLRIFPSIFGEILACR